MSSEPLAPFSDRRSRRWLLGVLLVAAALRLAHWGAVRDEPFFARLAMDSQEYDRWARELAAGEWLGVEPFFQAPLYPYLLGIVYLAGGGLDAVYLLQIAIALAGLWALARAGGELAGERLGLVAAGLGAVYLPFLFYDVQLLKTSLAVSSASLLLWLLVRARRLGTPSSFLAAGIVAGLLALLRENLLLVVPFLLPLVWRRGEESRRTLLRAAALVGGLALPLVPVALRNAALGGGFLPTTSQGGVNFWIGNNPEADGTYRPVTPGRQIPRLERAEPRRIAELESGRSLTDAEVSRHWLDKALSWATAEPARFAALQWHKLRLYWSGYEWPDAVDYYWTKRRSRALALPGLEFLAVALLAAAGALLLVREKLLARFAPVLLFELGWMVSTVAFFLFSRYRLPAVPGLLLLAALPVVRACELASGGRGRLAALLAGVGIALAWALPHVAGYAPREDLVEFNLGRLAEEAGDARGAAEHYQRAWDAAPGSLLPALDLGTLAARRGAYDEARAWFERAVAAAPGSPDAWSNLGGARLALGDLEGAAEALDRALALDAGHEAARKNRELVERLRRRAAQGSGGG